MPSFTADQNFQKWTYFVSVFSGVVFESNELIIFIKFERFRCMSEDTSRTEAIAGTMNQGKLFFIQNFNYKSTVDSSSDMYDVPTIQFAV